MTSATPIEPAYVLDTHALFWHLVNDQKLSQTAAAIFAAAYRGETVLFVSAISLAELYYIDQKHHIFPDFARGYQRLRGQAAFEFVSVAPDHVADFRLDSAVPEMHDRIITGLARRLGVPLLTVDPLIKAAGLVRTVW